MEEQKDTNEKTFKNKLSEQSLLSVSNYYEVHDQDQYVHLAHRSQKIVTALYMITDFLNTSDPLRQLVRSEVTSVMQNLFSAIHTEKIQRVELLSQSYNKLYSVISYFNIVRENGFVSVMNHSLVSHEMVLLCLDIDIQIKKSLPYDRKNESNRSVKEFSFTESFFQGNRHEKKDLKKDIFNIKDSIKDIKNKKSPQNQSKNIIQDKNFEKQKSISHKKTKNKLKNSRQENVLKILKQKKNASINDICSLIKDCSSKTIQRDLVDLIQKGLVRKEGNRRWSVYNLNY